MDRRSFLKGVLGSGVAVAAKKIAPSGLVELRCKGCGGTLDQAGDFFECTSCGSKYALGGVVMQKEREIEPTKKMLDVHRHQETISLFGTSSNDPYWGTTSCVWVSKEVL